MPQLLAFLNALFFLMVFVWLWRHFQKEQNGLWLQVGLVLKLIAGQLLGLYYQHVETGGDTLNLFASACILADLALQDTNLYLNILLEPSAKVYAQWTAALSQHDPRAYFFIKLLSVLALLNAKSYALTAFWLSLAAFWGLWQVSKNCARYSKTELRIWLGVFLYLPSALFWASGISKESACVFCLGLLFFLWPLFKTQKPYSYCYGLLAALVWYLLWRVKYPVALFVVVSVVLHGSLVLFFKFFRVRYVLGAFVLVGIAALVVVFYTMPTDAFLYALDRNREVMLANSSLEGITLLHFDRFSENWFLNTLTLLWSSCFAPLPWEAQHIKQYLAACENILALGVSVWVAGSFYLYFFSKDQNKNGFWQQNNAFWAVVLVYVCGMALLTGLSTPNWGTLMRYKVLYWPFVWVFLLQTIWYLDGKDKREPLN